MEDGFPSGKMSSSTKNSRHLSHPCILHGHEHVQEANYLGVTIRSHVRVPCKQHHQTALCLLGRKQSVINYHHRKGVHAIGLPSICQRSMGHLCENRHRSRWFDEA